MPDGKDISSRSSKVILRWINNPVVTSSWEETGNQEVSSHFEVELGGTIVWRTIVDRFSCSRGK